MDIDKILESKVFRAVILTIACIMVLLFVFGLGFSVGTRKADFSFKWAEQYHQNFAGPRDGFLGMGNIMMQDNFIDANGVIGEVISINGSKITIKGRENVEKIVVADEGTIIMCQRKNFKLSELKTGDSVVIMGAPNNNGQIEADFIRIMPVPTKGCLKDN